MESTTTRRLVRVPEAAMALSASRSLVYEWIASGELRSVKLGRARRIPADAIDEFIARREIEAAAAR